MWSVSHASLILADSESARRVDLTWATDLPFEQVILLLFKLISSLTIYHILVLQWKCTKICVYTYEILKIQENMCVYLWNLDGNIFLHNVYTKVVKIFNLAVRIKMNAKLVIFYALEMHSKLYI